MWKNMRFFLRMLLILAVTVVPALGGFAYYIITNFNGMKAHFEDYSSIQQENASLKEFQLHIANTRQYLKDASLSKDQRIIQSQARPEFDNSYEILKKLLVAYTEKKTSLQSREDYEAIYRNRIETPLQILTRVTNQADIFWNTGNQMFLAYAENKDTANEAKNEFDNAFASLSSEFKNLLDNSEGEFILSSKKMQLMMTDGQKNTVILMVTIVVLISIVAVILITTLVSVKKQLNNVTQKMSSSSSHLQTTADQVSASSQQLSNSSASLSSSIEEMTSSLEELQSIIETNTKNINEGKLLMNDANKTAQDSVVLLEDLDSAIGEISDNSKKIEKIIKVIDDIAFQTNILALNAAVEAARAGEAGRGFSVVAEQVKTLAQKSAEAAKETADLIDNAIKSVVKGKDLGDVVKDNAQKSGELMEKVNSLMEEVNRTSQEQLKGSNQVTQAIGQISDIVQLTSANSEETANAGEELTDQSEILNNMMVELDTVVNGKKKNTAAGNPQIEYKPHEISGKD